MRPPRWIMTAGLNLLMGMMGAWPSRPPKASSSPALLPMAGMTRTAVVLAVHHADGRLVGDHGAQITSAVVSPGMTTISRPTEHTAVMASSFSMRQAAAAGRVDHARRPRCTGMNAPDRPPHVGGGHHAALFHRVVQQGQGRRWCRSSRSFPAPSPPGYGQR